jgi:hypothetical protein
MWLKEEARSARKSKGRKEADAQSLRSPEGSSTSGAVGAVRQNAGNTVNLQNGGEPTSLQGWDGGRGEAG